MFLFRILGGLVMFFKRKGKLKKEFDEKLINQMRELKKDWNHKKELYNKSYIESEEIEMEMKLAEIKFFYLFKEVKKRKLKIN